MSAVLLSAGVGIEQRKYFLLPGTLNRSQDYNHYIRPLKVCHILTVNGEWVLSCAGSPRKSLLSQQSFLFPSRRVGLCREYNLTATVQRVSTGKILYLTSCYWQNLILKKSFRAKCSHISNFYCCRFQLTISLITDEQNVDHDSSKTTNLSHLN